MKKNRAFFVIGMNCAIALLFVYLGVYPGVYPGVYFGRAVGTVAVPPAVSAESAVPSAARAVSWLSPSLSTTVYLPLVAGPLPSPIVIAAAHIDSVLSGEADEALLLWNRGVMAQPLAGWTLTTPSRRATFPITSTLTLGPGEQIWCAAEAATFRLTFGETPVCEWATDSDPTVPNLDGKLALANGGGRIQLYSAAGALVDTLLYGDESRPAAGWVGAAVQLYTRGDIPREGQLWQRKRDPLTGLPLDTDLATDWSADLADLAWGRQVRMPGWLGWDQPALAAPQTVSATATITVAIGPEGLYQPLAAFITRSQQSLDLSLYTIEHRALTEAIAAAAQRGVRVRLLLEGSPPGGISAFQKWCVATIAAAGGEVRYLAVRDDAPKGYRTRYRFLHAKYGISDGRLAFNGTENFGYDSMPVDTSAPTGGRRGFYLLTDATPVVARLQELFAIDWQPERFADLFPFTLGHAKYGGPPADFLFPELPLYPIGESPFREAVSFSGNAAFALVSAPENATRPDRGIHALIARAGAGDAIAAMQLYEQKNWGDSTSNPVADPNPRLEALIAAARRGAQVQILLDSYFDDPSALRNNQAAVDYINQIALREGLALTARRGNPTLGGIHAKLILLRLGEAHWSAVGSLNGSEVSHKLNREVVVLTDMPGVYERLLRVFDWDWVQK